MKKVLIQDNFYKSVPPHKRKKVEKLCEKIEIQLNKSGWGIYGTFLAAQSKKFRGMEQLFKFRASDGDRIMFTYTECLKNYREEYGSGICLIEYISQHDQQNRKARSYNENSNRSVEDIEHNEEITLEIEEAKEEEYSQYKTYLDLDKTIVYVKNENELSKLVRESDDLVYISNEQFEYVCDMRAAILMGGAGSGKTLVCLHKLNNYKGYGEKAYFTYSESLKKKAEKIFNKVSSNSDEISFNTLESYCLSFLGLSESMQASKKQLDLYKDELGFVADYFKNLPDEIENKIKKIDNQHSKTRKKTVEDIKKDINTQFVDFEKEILKSINDTVDRVISEKIQFMFNEFDNITNGAIEAINRNDYLYAVDTIYNLYVNNGRSLPLYVRRKTWTGNFYFRVDTIERDDGHNFGLTAYGVRFKDDIFYDQFYISADLKQFEIQPMEFVSNIDITPIDDGDIPF